MQHTLTHPPIQPSPSSKPGILTPLPQLPAPPTRHNDTTDNIHQPDHQRQQPAPLLRNDQQDRLDVVLDEDAGHVLLRDLVRLLRDGVLVRPDRVPVVRERVDVGRVGGDEARGVGRVHGGHDGEVVLEFHEVLAGGGEGVVERVFEGGDEGAEGEFVDLVREVECFEESVSMWSHR